MKKSRRKSERLESIAKFVFDQSKSPKRQSGHERRRKSFRVVRRVFPIVASAILVVLFVYAGRYYSSTQTRISANPLVVNLTEKGLSTRVQFGNSPDCGGTPCWVDPQFADSSWQDVTLPLSPSSPIGTMDGYDQGIADGWMYYRLTIEIPETLQNAKDEISFTPLFIQHKKYFVYLNGRLVFSSDGVALGRIANFPIPRQDIANNRVHFTIKASVQPDDIGIAHYHSVLLGPKPVLDQAYLFNQHSQYTYYLLFLLTKGAIFVIFSVFFLYTRGQPGFLNFLMYAFFTTVENLFIGDFLFGDDMLSLQQRVFAFYTCKALALTSLIAFVINFHQAQRLRPYGYALGALITTATAWMAYDFGWGSQTVTYNALWAITNNSLVGVITLAICLGLVAIWQWRQLPAADQQLKTYRTFTLFLMIYYALILEEFYFKTYTGFDKRALLDLAFFFVLALITAKDMGFKEGRLRTFEGHMAEKRRMELELQEAAEIAKAFIPTTVPDWGRVSIDTFHKPLTETSGDWFTFEQSSNRKYFHFVMCDITGHGVQAAIVVSTCRSVFGSLVRSRPDAPEHPDFIQAYAEELNSTLFENGGGYHVSTLLGLTFEPDAQRLHFISAGHPPPLQICRNAQGSWVPRALVSRNNVLGIHAEFKGEMQTVEFAPEDQLITYTDGLPLGSNIKALKRFLKEYAEAGNTAATLKERIWAAEAARTNQQPADDISIVWFKGVA